MASEDTEQTAEGVPTTDNAEAAAAEEQAVENQELFASIDLPENLVRFTKLMPDGTEAHLVMSRMAVRELGGYNDVERVFQNAAHEQRFTFLYTQADLDFAESDQYRQPEERTIDAKVRYMEENFGGIIRLMSDDYDDMDRDELVEAWRTVFLQNNFHLVGDNETFGMISLNLDEFFKGFDDLAGSRQQQIDFLLGHEIDHGDNYDAESDGPKGLFAEVLSDRTGISGIQQAAHPLAFWSRCTNPENFERSLVAERVEHEITRILVYKETGRWPDSDRWDHNTAPFLTGDDENMDAELPDHAADGLAELEKRIAAKGGETLHRELRANYNVPSDPQSLVFGSTIMGGVFVDEHFMDVLDALNIPPDRYEEYEDRYDDLDSDDLIAAKALLEELKAEFPDQVPAAVSTVFYGNVFSEVEDLFDDPILPPPLVEELERELDAIYEIEDELFQAQAYAEFVERFLNAYPHVYQNFIYDEVPELAVMTAIELDQDAWEKTVEAIAATILPESDIQDPQMRRAFEIFLEERNLDVAPAATPKVEEPAPDRATVVPSLAGEV